METRRDKGNIRIVLILVIVLVLAIGGFAYYYFFVSKDKSEEKAEITPSAAIKKGDVGYREPTTTVKIGTKEVSKGNFQKIANATIYYKDGTDTFQLPLSTDEIAVNCTNQPLENATELDYNQIKSVKVYNAETLIGKIPQNGYIVVFSSMVGDTLRVHSIALSASDCGQ